MSTLKEIAILLMYFTEHELLNASYKEKFENE